MTTLLETIFTTIDTHIDNKLTNSNGHAAQPLFPHEDGDRRNLTTSDIVEMQKTLQGLDDKLQRHEERLDANSTIIGEHEERLDTHSTAIDENESAIENVFCGFDVTDYCDVSELVSEHIDVDSIAHSVANELKITVA